MRGWENVEVCDSCKGAGCKLCGGKGYLGNLKKTPKYRNKKTMVDGITFDSQAEAEYYEYLKTLKAAGHIDNVTLQPKFELQPAWIDQNEVKRPAIHYIADFHVMYADGRELIVDVKGMETKEFILKRKIYEYKAAFEDWPILSIIALDRHYGWVKLDELKKLKRQTKGVRANGKKTPKEKTKPGAKAKGKSGKGRDL
jgi:hypothetical protein